MGRNAYINGVMKEAYGNIPLTHRYADAELVNSLPGDLQALPVGYNAAMSRAVKARRAGFTRADAVEAAYDGLIRGSGFRRVGEVIVIRDKTNPDGGLFDAWVVPA